MPIPSGQKAPTDTGWLTRDYTVEDFAEGDNVGVKVGKPSGWLIDTDCDCPEAVAAAAHLMPETGLLHGRKGNPSSHLWYIVPEMPSLKFMDVDNRAMLLEVRSTGLQTVVPPSVHKTGEAIQWERHEQPLVMTPEDYGLAAKTTAIAALFGRHWPPGGRHYAAGYLAGFLIRCGLEPPVVARIVWVAATIAGDEEANERRRFATDTCEKHASGGKTTGRPKLAEAFTEGEALIELVYRWLERKGEKTLDQMNERHFVVELGADMVVATEYPDKAVAFGSFEKLRQRYYAQKVGKTRMGEWWLSNPKHRAFRQVEFAPPPLIAHPSDYNLWRGFAVEPDPNPRPGERCIRYLDHIFRTICGGEQKYFEYFLNVLAITVQQPGMPSEVAVVMRGDPGSGKGTAISLFGELFGAHYLHVDKAKHVTGAFNAHMSSKVVLFADEAVWGGSKQDVGALRRLVTERTLAIERKYMDTVQERNCLHLFMATNESWVWPVSIRERRAFILDVDLKAWTTREYFNAIREEWVNGGAQALLAFCQQRPIEGGRLTSIPKTQALADQQNFSLEPLYRWWLEKLQTGELARGAGWPGFIATSWAVDNFNEFHRGARGWSSRQLEFEVRSGLIRMLPPTSIRKRMKTTVNVNPGMGMPIMTVLYRHGLTIPPLEDCRRFFDRLTGVERTWLEPEASDEIGIPLETLDDL